MSVGGTAAVPPVHPGAVGDDGRAAPMPPLIPKRAPIGDNQDDCDVLENGVVVGRIFTVPTAPEGRPWMWASAAYAYAETREAAMAAFAKSWRREK